MRKHVLYFTPEGLDRGKELSSKNSDTHLPDSLNTLFNLWVVGGNEPNELGRKSAISVETGFTYQEFLGEIGLILDPDYVGEHNFWRDIAELKRTGLIAHGVQES